MFDGKYGLVVIGGDEGYIYDNPLHLSAVNIGIIVKEFPCFLTV